MIKVLKSNRHFTHDVVLDNSQDKRGIALDAKKVTVTDVGLQLQERLQVLVPRSSTLVLCRLCASWVGVVITHRL